MKCTYYFKVDFEIDDNVCLADLIPDKMIRVLTHLVSLDKDIDKVVSSDYFVHFDIPAFNISRNRISTLERWTRDYLKKVEGDQND